MIELEGIAGPDLLGSDDFGYSLNVLNRDTVMVMNMRVTTALYGDAFASALCFCSLISARLFLCPGPTESRSTLYPPFDSATVSF